MTRHSGLTARFCVLCFITVAVMVLYVALSSPKRRLAIVEQGRLWVDKLTCSPQAHDRMRDGYDVAAINQRSVPEICYPIVAADRHGVIDQRSLPSVYIADKEVLPLFAAANCTACPEINYFLRPMQDNKTGNIVSDSSLADFVFVPFPASCQCTEPLGKDALPLALAAVDHLPGHKFTINRRPFPERTNARRLTRTMLKEFPDVRAVVMETGRENMQRRGCVLAI